MTITELGDLIGRELVVRYYPNQGGRWCASIDGVEVKSGIMLESMFRNGVTPADAVAKYALALEGHTIVLNATRPNRIELTVPRLAIP